MPIICVNRLTQVGDTIVEVMIAVAIAGATLVGSYAVVNHTTLTQQETLERSEALGVATGQLERIKAAALVTANVPVLFGAMPYCISDLEAPVQFTATPTVPASSSTYPNECKVGVDQRYNVGTSATLQPGGEYLLQVYVTWSGPTGSAERANITYRMFK